jgi:DNA-binding transcriptional MerR regulator
MRTIGEVAELAGVSRRTLRHYDELGLVVPGSRSDAGYRLYGHADLERLQEVLALRALGLPLAEVAALLDDPAHDRLAVLRGQAERLRAEQGRLAGLLVAVEGAITAADRGTHQKEQDMFDGHDHETHAAEAERRWGDSDAWRQSQQRTATHDDVDRQRSDEERAANEEAFAALLRAGVPADDARTAPLVQEHRDHVTRWYYDCSVEIQRGLAAMYVADARFAGHYDRRQPGLARFVHDAILAHTAV